MDNQIKNHNKANSNNGSQNEILNRFEKKFGGKKVAVLGIGVSNTPLIKFLVKYGAQVTACDRADKEKLADFLEELKDLPVKYQLGDGYLEGMTGYAYIFRTPVIRYDLPELVEAANAGVVITSEMEVFFELCPAKIFAVTGSDGKTTTTTVIYNILKEDGYRCWLGGNIGNPLLSHVGEMLPEDMVVVELSSYQLQTMRQSPDVSVVTNLTPNHLDVHKSMEEYVDAKKNIFIHQEKSGRVVLNYDNDITREFAGLATGKVVFFSRKVSLNEGAILKEGMLTFRNGSNDIEIVRDKDMVILGVHNVENYLAAIGAVMGYVKPESITKVAKRLGDVEHRNSFVREVNGVKFYNNSIASSPNRTISTLNSFDDEVILIAGGKDKKIPYDPIGEVILNKVKKLVLVGQTSPQIRKALEDAIVRTGSKKVIPIIQCYEFKDAVLKAYDGAGPGDIILLSPASTSFDMFRNFEERGNLFAQIVNEL